MTHRTRSTLGRHVAVLCHLLCGLLAMAAPGALAQGSSTSAWTGDATVTESPSTVVGAYSLGASADAVINGVTFTGIAGANPAVGGKFSIDVGGNYVNDSNNITTLGGGARFWPRILCTETPRRLWSSTG